MIINNNFLHNNYYKIKFIPNLFLFSIKQTKKRVILVFHHLALPSPNKTKTSKVGKDEIFPILTSLFFFFFFFYFTIIIDIWRPSRSIKIIYIVIYMNISLSIYIFFFFFLKIANKDYNYQFTWLFFSTHLSFLYLFKQANKLKE